jgi:hypothetical protein
VVVRVRRVIVGDDLCGRSDPRSGCCQRCCQLVDLADPIPRLPDLPPARRRSCCRTARPELSSCERRQCTSDSSLPPKLKVPGRIRIHLSSVDVHTSSAATHNQHQWQASSVFRTNFACGLRLFDDVPISASRSICLARTVPRRNPSTALSAIRRVDGGVAQQPSLCQIDSFGNSWRRRICRGWHIVRRVIL